MELKTISIPSDWETPNYSFGQRTQHGVIVSMDYYPKDSLLAKEFGEGWRYSVMPNKHVEELQHYLEEEMKPLTDVEIQEQLQAELEEHQRQVEILQQQLATMASGSVSNNSDF